MCISCICSIYTQYYVHICIAQCCVIKYCLKIYQTVCMVCTITLDFSPAMNKILWSQICVCFKHTLLVDFNTSCTLCWGFWAMTVTVLVCAVSVFCWLCTICWLQVTLWSWPMICYPNSMCQRGWTTSQRLTPQYLSPCLRVCLEKVCQVVHVYLHSTSLKRTHVFLNTCTLYIVALLYQCWCR